MPGFRKGKLPGNFGKNYPPEVFRPQEILALMAACGKAPSEVRNRALIAFLWRTGARIQEALNVDERRDLSRDTGWVHFRTGKSPGRVAMDDWGWEQLQPWLDIRGRYPAGPLFCVVEGPTKGVTKMGASSFRVKLKELASRAGVTKDVRPHGFRHTLAMELALDPEVDMLHIQRHLRHKSLAATAAYLSGIAPADTINVIRKRRPSWLDEASGGA